MNPLYSVFERLLRGPEPSVGLLDPVRVELTAWPLLCDLQGHITHSRYLDLMALGRGAWIARTGLLKGVLAQGYAYIVAGAGVTYRREIRRMSRFSLQLRVAAFDQRWLCFEYEFLLRDRQGYKVAARAFTRGQIQQRKRGCEPAHVLRSLLPDVPLAQPAASSDFQAWIAAQDATVQRIREQGAAGSPA